VREMAQSFRTTVQGANREECERKALEQARRYFGDGMSLHIRNSLVQPILTADHFGVVREPEGGAAFSVDFEIVAMGEPRPRGAS